MHRIAEKNGQRDDACRRSCTSSLRKRGEEDRAPKSPSALRYDLPLQHLAPALGSPIEAHSEHATSSPRVKRRGHGPSESVEQTGDAGCRGTRVIVWRAEKMGSPASRGRACVPSGRFCVAVSFTALPLQTGLWSGWRLWSPVFHRVTPTPPRSGTAHWSAGGGPGTG